MRKVSIKIARLGEKLARDIITDNGNVLLRAGRELNTVLLQRLGKLNIDTIYIEDKLTARPIIRIISDADGSPVTYQRNLDLSLHHNLTILKLV
jgi:hypothetical protein